jgi:hypothetical protein
MRLDPSQISTDPRSALAGGAFDAARGGDTVRAAEAAQAEAEFETVDRQLLTRMRAALLTEAADVTISFADIQATAQRTRELMGNDPAAARAAHGTPSRARLHGLLDA